VKSDASASRIVTYPNEIDQSSDREQNEISNQKPNDPNQFQLPWNAAEAEICPHKKIPVIQLNFFESRSHIVFNNRFNARL
jgi:hypothetical protein